MQPPFARLLGMPVLCLAEGGELALPAERRNQMLAYLACTRRWVRRDELAALLWGDREQASARSNLRNVVMQARRAAVPGFDAHGEMLRWEIGTDLLALEAAVAARDWPTATAAPSGSLLEGFELDAPPAFADWLQFERARVDALRRESLAARLRQLDDDPHECSVVALAALRAAPLDETALGAYLRAQSALGAAAEVERAWRAYVERLADEHGVEPAADLRALAAKLAPARAASRAAPSAPEAPFNCVGRRLELVQIRHLLAEHECRVLTVTGPGGVGKSTLARAAMPLLESGFDGGVAWVALEDLAQGDEVAARIAASMALTLRGADAPLAQVARRLREQPAAVFVFDNAEHLADLPRVLAQLLAACPQLKLLVTSRARLGMAGEWLLPLEGLPVPDSDEREPDVLRVFDAVKLFEARARAMTPGFDLAAQAAEVVELMHAVDGLPLALELAATWTRLLPVREIVAELRRSLDLLAAPAGTDGRERSVHASFEHSWRLLSPREREVLPRLAVFAGSFSRTAAEHVAAAPLPVLAALVDRSLLRAGGDGRFSMHPLLRQCALQRLPDRDDRNELRRRHADFYSRMYARYSAFASTDQKKALDELALEVSNARDAWLHAIDTRASTTLGRMAMPMRHYYWERGRPDEGIELLLAATRLLDDTIDAEREPLGSCLFALASLERSKGNFESVEALARRALALFESLAHGTEARGCLSLIGTSLWQRSRNEEASSCFEQMLRQAQTAEDAAHVAIATGNLALVHYAQGRYDDALPLFLQALETDRSSGNARGEVIGLNNIGLVHLQRGETQQALHVLEQALDVSDRHGLAGIRVYSLLNVGLAQLALGDLAQATRRSREALSEARTHQVLQIELEAELALARLAARGAAPEDPAARVRSAVARATGYPTVQLHGVIVFARLLAARGERERAAAYLAYAAHDVRLAHHLRTEALQALDALALPDVKRAAAGERAAALTLEAIVQEIGAAAAPAPA